MALKDQVRLGVSFPSRTLEPAAVPLIIEIAQRAEALGFEDLWVGENTIDPPPALDALTVLGFAAGVTSTIGLGVAVILLPLHHPLEVAHRVTTLDFLSAGRIILGVGLGTEAHYPAFQVPLAHRVTRYREAIELMKRLWTEEQVSYSGRFYSIENVVMEPKPVQKPYPPLWLGGDHPDNLRRAVELADGWIASGASTNAKFSESVATLRSELERVARDPLTFTISKRVRLFVDDDPERARAEVERWFGNVYRDSRFNSAGMWGTPAEVVEQLEGLVAAGADHLVLQPLSHHREQVEQLAALVGLSASS